jgi:D-arabinose 1-dehydrogenase-like Zn-dependent alcohol dehydrogenase
VRGDYDVGVGPEPIEITSQDLIFGERKVAGSLTGNPATGDATLRFSALTGVSAMIETVPFQEAPSRLREDDGREGALSNGAGHERRRE